MTVDDTMSEEVILLPLLVISSTLSPVRYCTATHFGINTLCLAEDRALNWVTTRMIT